MRFLIKLLAAAFAVWLTASLVLFGLMWLPPETFASAIGRIPAPVVLGVLPFQPLWTAARSGSFAEGDLAPDFTLRTLDQSATVRLSSHRGQCPVVLIFGSYT